MSISLFSLFPFCLLFLLFCCKLFQNGWLTDVQNECTIHAEAEGGGKKKTDYRGKKSSLSLFLAFPEATKLGALARKQFEK